MAYEITVLIRIRDGQDVEAITAAVVEFGKKTAQAPGCNKFTISQALNSNTLILFESWENVEVFKAYNASAQFREFSANQLENKTDREFFITQPLPVIVQRSSAEPTFFRL